jgi:hypothetical protein
MVEDVTTDGRRIAELLASEVTGLAVGPLADASVVDAEPDVEPTAEGALAYRIEYAGERIGAVRVRPEAAIIDLRREWPPDASDAPGLAREAGGTALVVERGAAVKSAVDAIRASLEP